ncbi:unnamed protein product [Toxocara canis]|uniref:Uncharacterized protein n=1 Tax=Toxocara canis TaxID=6265 RepID=A0A183UZ55_TOXCA|nr:unnamed protein product [Toxocara canis]
MEEQLLKTPEPRKVERHFENEISTPSQPDTVETVPAQPQRAQIAYYRPFVPDPLEETTLPEPERQTASYHDVSEICGLSKQPSMSTLERPKEKRAEMMYCRPGFDNKATASFIAEAKRFEMRKYMQDAHDLMMAYETNIFRPFIPDPMEETILPTPERRKASYHDVSEIGGLSKQASLSTLEYPEEKKADLVYYRPGFDNVPSY